MSNDGPPGMGSEESPAGSRVSMQFMITKAMESQLSALGYSESEIGAMAPPDAAAIIERGLPSPSGYESDVFDAFQRATRGVSDAFQRATRGEQSSSQGRPPAEPYPPRNPSDSTRRVRVHLDEINGRNGMMKVSTQILERIASLNEIDIPPKMLKRASGRPENDRVWEKIRSDVEANWIDAWPGRDTIELPSRQDRATEPW